MRLLLDANLSPRLVGSLDDLYPGTTHVREVGLASAEDSTIWECAAANGFTIVSKDADFHQRSFLLGYPPKVVWLRRGNCSSLTTRRKEEHVSLEDSASLPEPHVLAAEIADDLRAALEQIEDVLEDLQARAKGRSGRP